MSMGKFSGMFTGVFACGVLGVCALAQPGDRSQVDIKARVKGTSAWLDKVDVSAGTNDPVDIEVAVFLYRSSGYGMCGASCDLITSNWTPADVVTLLDRADSTMHPDGRQGSFNFGGQAQAAFTTGAWAGRLRISDVNQSELPQVSMKQNTPANLGSGFDTSDGNMAFRFDLTLANPNPGFSSSRTLVTSTQNNGFVSKFMVYASPSATTPTTIFGLPLADAATMNVHWTNCSSACAADFDCNGFATGDDFDSFVAAFEAGFGDADFDGNGFVNGDDFDAYVVAFETGC